MTKQKTSFTLELKTLETLKELSADTQFNQSAFIEFLINEYATKRKSNTMDISLKKWYWKQQAAYKMLLTNPHPYLYIQGSPGSGITTFVQELVLELHCHETPFIYLTPRPQFRYAYTKYGIPVETSAKKIIQLSPTPSTLIVDDPQDIHSFFELLPTMMSKYDIIYIFQSIGEHNPPPIPNIHYVYHYAEPHQIERATSLRRELGNALYNRLYLGRQ